MGLTGQLRLNQIIFLFFIFFLISSFNIVLIAIEFYNLFWFVLYEKIIISWPGSQIWKVNLIEPSQSNMLLFQYIFFFKKYHLEFLWVKLYLYQPTRLFINPSSQSNYIELIIIILILANSKCFIYIKK